MPSDRYILRSIRLPRRYVVGLDDGGVVELTRLRREAWVGCYGGSGSEDMDDLERLYGDSEIVDDILARYERVELPPCK